ncbi:MAG: PCRF domain-containing protein, partial [Chitinivibrionales bacterium]
MLEKVKDKIARYYELEELMASPEVTANPEKLKTVGKEFNELESAVGMLKEYVEAVEGKKEAEALISEGTDSDLIELANEEIKKYNS